MISSFWSNTIWYVLLFITSIISMVFILLKSKTRKFNIAFTLATLGFIYLIESILVILFDAYSYYPKIVDDLFQDTVLGNVFSQVSISTTSSLSIIYGLSYKWYFIFATIYYLIEELFINLGIYRHFWYKSVYTIIGFIPLFWFIKKWYNKINNSSAYLVHYITLFFSTFAAVSNTIIMPMKLLGIQIFKVNFFGEFSRNHTATAIIYVFFLINILMNLHMWKTYWVWKGIVFTILFIIQYLFYKAGIIYFRNGYFLIITIVDLFGIYLWITIFNRFLSQKPTAQYNR